MFGCSQSKENQHLWRQTGDRDLSKKIDLVVYPNGWSGPVFCIFSEQQIETDGQEVLYEAKPVLLMSGQVICMLFVLANKQYIHVDLYVCQTNNNIIAMVALQKAVCF